MIIYPKANVVRFYNIKKDTDELIDLADQKKYKKGMDKLFLRFIKLQKEMADTMDVRKYYDNFFAKIQ